MLRTMIPRVRQSFRIIRLFCTAVEREVMEYDVLVVGAGIAGLSTAIKIKQISAQYDRPVSVCVIQKGSDVGDHTLSGNCMQTRGFDELFPKWRSFERSRRPPIDTPVTDESFQILLSQEEWVSIPQFLLPKMIQNSGNYVVSLSKLTRWMGDQAAELGVDIFPGTPGAQISYGEDGSVSGVVTAESGVSKKGQKKENYDPGRQIRARQTVLAEGARGYLSQIVISKFNLRDQSYPPKYSLGLKEVWEVDNKFFDPGYVQHTVGWPLSSGVYGGSFLYHMKPNIVHVGLVVGLDYKNPYLNPYEQFQRMKGHSNIRKYLEGGNCLSYGSKVSNSDGYLSLPKLVFPGGVLVGCGEGFMNPIRIEGCHTAIQSGIEAGKAIYDKLTQPQKPHEDPRRADSYQTNMRDSWVYKELYESRNFRYFFNSLSTGLAYGAVFKLLKGRQPFNIASNKKDCETTQPKQRHQPIDYPKPDGKLTFDLLENLARSGIHDQHDQPNHLVIRPFMQNRVLASHQKYAGPEQRFCPAKVFEFVETEDVEKKLQMHPQRCLHCKACTIKSVDEYIEWQPPKGTGGPKYDLM